MYQPDNAIVVGVARDGSDGAIQFAIQEARRSGSPVHLVHVLELPPGEAYAGVYGGALENAHTVVERAQRRGVELAGGRLPVTSELADRGWVVGDLVARSQTARMVVLQHRDLGRLHRLATGSITNGVAARAHAPVVSVHEAWSPDAHNHGVVTAAVQDPLEAERLLRTAFYEAREREASLTVLHAWWLANGYDDIVVDDNTRTEWEARTREELEPVLAPLRDRFPGVEVSVEVRHSPAVQAVLEASDRSDLVVLGRRHHLLPLFTHLGPVARTALGHSTSPVLLTPEPESEPSLTH